MSRVTEGFSVTQQPNSGQGRLAVAVSRSHQRDTHSRWDSPARVIGTSQSPLPAPHTTHTKQTNVRTLSGSRNRDTCDRTPTVTLLGYPTTCAAVSCSTCRYLRYAEVTFDIFVLLSIYSCSFRYTHVTFDILMLLSTYLRYFRYNYVTFDILMLLSIHVCYFRYTCYFRYIRVTFDILMLRSIYLYYFRYTYIKI